MGRLIVTGTKTVKVPYYMEESGHLLYSYEELCYYIKTRTPMWMQEKSRPGMTKWLSGCGVEIEDIDSCSPIAAAEKITEAGTYFRKEEKAQLIRQLKDWNSYPEVEREKMTADMYLGYGRLKKACLSYTKILGRIKEKESDSFQCSYYHNMGLACLQMFYWDDAVRWLSKALELGQKKETQTALSIALEMRKKEWKTGGGSLSSQSLEKKKEEFVNEL